MLEKTGSTFIYRVYAEGESLFSAEKSLKDYLSAFQDKFGVSLVHEEEKQYEILRNKNPSAPPSSLYEPAAIKALSLYKENRKWYSTDDVKLR